MNAFLVPPTLQCLWQILGSRILWFVFHRLVRGLVSSFYSVKE
jgi:hypothetical protein